MASSQDFVSYVCEQLEGVGSLRSRKMFGEYMIYVNEKPVLMVCDNLVYVKVLPCLAALLSDHPTAPPYPGAKEHYILDPDEGDELRQAAILAEAVTPLPKKRTKPKKTN